MERHPYHAGLRLLLTLTDIVESPERRQFSRRSVVLVAGAAVLLALAWGAVALRPEKVKQPTLAGWPAVGSRAHDNKLRKTSWQAWAKRDPSVKLERTAILFADDWREGQRTVVLLETQDVSGAVRVAVVLVNGQEAERYSTRRLTADRNYITEVVEANGQSAALAVAPGIRSVVLTTATVGAVRAQETEITASGGVLLPVPAGHTATRVVLKDERGKVLLDRLPGADEAAKTLPVVGLIVSESIDAGGRRVQIRSDGGGVTCQVVLADPETESPALVECPPS